MLHEKFDVEKFKAMFPLADLRRQAREFVLEMQRESPARYADAAEVEKHISLVEPSGEIVTSPYHIAVIEQLREEAAADLAGIERVPTDVFIFAQGEPKDRRVTKIGGLPFWPRDRKWPTTADDRPLRFVAQFCFADSSFIFKDLRGKILSIFCPPPRYDADHLQCFWLDTRATDLVTPEEVPELDHLMPVYGVLHRTYDYAELPQSMDRYRRSYHLGQIEGTKIGGLPRWIQYPEDLPGRFLCALGSVHPEARRPYPYVNIPDVPDRRPTSRAHRSRALMWGDVGSVYFFLDEQGQVRSTEQCY